MLKPGSNNRFIKAERLCSKKHIDLLFQKGNSKGKGCLRIIWSYTDDILDTPLQVMFSVPKKQFRRAVDRNLLKRRMREAYRLKKHELYERIKSENKYLQIAFIYVGKKVEDYTVIESDLKGLLTKIIMSK